MQQINRLKRGFNSEVDSRWLQDGRRMLVLKPLEFIDKSGNKWVTPKDSVVDGASIPKFLWHIIGSPFVGKYRRITVIHDYYCQIRTKSSREVHRTFYDGMLFDGVNPAKAWLMYKGVKWFGPDWK